MAWATFNNSGQVGIDGLLIFSAQTVNVFIPMLLFSLFIIATIGSYLGNKRLFGKEDFWGSCVVASVFTTIVAFILSLLPGVISPIEIMICIAISAVFIVIFMNRD